ncbi:virus tail fiber assembly protein lambda gpK [Collimonas sp. PA-H2]|uniref:tail fiber assembly protein n=1 Tax=Collimonas sp. PA-H2 TaxID=1881062 RepID=UPI000C0028CE|nr:tail fiber assembly protein [Collimonas sp. PA-H2]PFH10857.1 virus tail fiber assembly protein lambda gpK [Collimonas sp. PA-H2]
MKIYHYHPDTAVYLSTSSADVSPLEPGIFLVPAYATGIAPPDVSQDEQATFAEDKWAIEPIPQPEEVKPVPPTESQLTATAIGKRDQLLADATLAMAPLQDAVELDDAMPAELALLRQWKQYRVAVNRVPNQENFPHVITWPPAPGITAH